jgi:flagellar protein FlaJ
MKEKKDEKRGILKRFFSAIGGGVFKTGKAARRLGTAVKISKAPPEKADELSWRLQEIKRLESIREEELKGGKLLEEKRPEERAELKRPFSERLSELFYGPLKRPAARLANYFKGLDEDLYRANMRATPEQYAAVMIGVSAIVAIFTDFMMVLLRMPFLLVPLGGLAAFGFSLMFIRTRPGRIAKARVGEINKLIPYVLRHMATQLSSGISLPETMTSVGQADYGTISEEFGRVIKDMNAGMSTEEALTSMDKRVDSEPLRRATRQIQRTLRTGGDLAKTLNSLAEETAFEIRMKLRDYTQSLNLITMVYMFASAVLPAMLMIVVMISAAGGGGGITTQTAGVLYLILLPVMLMYFVIMIKRFEPRL